MTETDIGGRFFEDVEVGEQLPDVTYPLTVYRLVMAAGANRDFNSIHHNSEYARSTGAPDMYANTAFLMSSWERCVRDWTGLTGTIRSMRGFRMRSFNVVGDTMRVRAEVAELRDESGADPAVGTVEIAIRCENSRGVTVGPGVVEVTLPRRSPRREETSA
jgi:acyl dehydratase